MLSCREAGKLGAVYGHLGGRPRKKVEEMSIVPCGTRRERADVRVAARDETFGPQAKLRLCALYDEMMKQGVSPHEAVRQLVESSGRTRQMVKKAIEGRQKWQTACEAAGWTSKGLHPEEAHLPMYLRKREISKAAPKRMPGGGNKSTMDFLFPAMKILV